MVFRAYTGVELQSSNWFSKTRSTKLNRFSATQKKKISFFVLTSIGFRTDDVVSNFQNVFIKKSIIKNSDQKFSKRRNMKDGCPIITTLTSDNSSRYNVQFRPSTEKTGENPYVNSTTRICSRYTVAHKCPSISTTLRHEQIRRSCFLFASRTNVKYTTNCTLPL